MSRKERDRIPVMRAISQAEMTLEEAARVLKLSSRQARRIWKRYLAEGDAGLVHRSRGRPGPRSKDKALRVEVLACVRARYPDFGPTLAVEYLAREHGLKVDHETLRRWMAAEGLRQPRRRRQKHRARRERSVCYGQMVQFDGSHHDWFEGRAEPCCLMGMVDDATNRTWARFSSKETSRACYDIFEQWVERNGLPRSLYADRHSIYLTQREPTVTEQLAGKEPKTQFGRAMEQLGVKLIPAGSPQAKGRVERMNGTLQDRLVKAMRLEGISDMERANDYLAKSFLPELNRRFMRVAARRVDLHQRKREGAQRSVELGGATSGAERLDGELEEKELPVGSATREPEFGGENDHREAFERREPADGCTGERNSNGSRSQRKRVESGKQGKSRSRRRDMCRGQPTRGDG